MQGSTSSASGIIYNIIAHFNLLVRHYHLVYVGNLLCLPLISLINGNDRRKIKTHSSSACSATTRSFSALAFSYLLPWSKQSSASSSRKKKEP